MATNGQPRQRREASSLAPSTITEICRRYFATATALAKVMGLPLTEAFIHDWRESITTCFIESSRAGVRLPERVRLPPLAPAGPPTPELEPDPLPAGEGAAPEASTNGQGEPPSDGQNVRPNITTPSDTPPPSTIPVDVGLPCGGVAIAALKPAQLAMLVSKVAQRVHAEGAAWVPLLGALQSERATRLERRRKRVDLPTGVE